MWWIRERKRERERGYTMARNQEKAQSTLSRFYKAKNDALIKTRPYLASECHDLKEAEKWRMQVIRDAAKAISQIQNPALGEFRIREVNDEINKFLREKKHWQERIIELGGPNYFKVGPKMLDYEGKEVPGDAGYRYFGAARDLPGVRELFEQAVPDKKRVTRGELAKKIDADYYGYRDDDDGILKPLEAEAEVTSRAKAQAKWEEERRTERGVFVESYTIESRYGSSKYSHSNVVDGDQDMEGEDDKREPQAMDESAYSEVVSVDDMKLVIMERKKRELMSRYVSEELSAQVSV